jgi:iron complex outermembrane recepter protein
MKFSTTGRAFLLAASAFVALSSAPAVAQEAPAQATGAEPTRRLEAVIVTATRREESLQDVPVSVTAVPEALVQNAGIRDIRDLTQVTPSLQVPVSENSSSVTARIRGVGTQGSNPGLESAVGVLVDGVVRARNGVAFGDLGEIERIEVLRGPQGTLFGRNTSAGVINVITKKPEFDASGKAELTVGDFGTVGGSLGVTGALFGSDTAAGRLFVAYRKRDGFMTVNPGTRFQREDNNQDYWTARGQVLFQLGDTAELRVIADVARREEACCAAATKIAGPTTALINGIGGSTGRGQLANTRNTIEDYIAYANRTYDQIIDDAGLSAELTWDIGPGTLTSVTGWRNWKYQYGQDSDFTGLDILFRVNDGSATNEFTTISQELRYAGTTGIVDWLVGAYFSNEKIVRKERLQVGADSDAYFRGLLGANAALLPLVGITPGISVHALGSGANDLYEQDATSVALFTHNVFNLTDKLKATIGLRYTQDEKDFEAVYRTVGVTGCAAVERRFGLNAAGAAGALAGVAGVACQPWTRSALDLLPLHKQSRTENEWSGQFNVAYQFTDFINAYATYSRGYKAGGFNLDRAFSDARGSIVSGAPGAQTVRGPDTSFEGEFVDSYEVGVKSEWFGGDLVANLSLYQQEFENYQLNTFTGISFVVTGVPKVKSEGVELDFVWAPPIDGITFNGGFAYALTEYQKDLGGVGRPGSFLALNPGLLNLPGNQLTSAPLWTVSGGATYEREVGANLMFKAYLDARYTSDYRTGSNLDPRKTTEAYTLINGRVGLGHIDETWSVELWGRNLTDERYAQITFDAFAQGSAPALNSAFDSATAANARANSTIGAFLGEPRTWGITLKAGF